jgi:hypothetical protein
MEPRSKAKRPKDPDCEIKVITGRSHRDRKTLAVDSNLERFFRDDIVVDVS